MYRSQIESRAGEAEAWFDERAPHQDNDMTGIFAGKNVVLVLMESMDDFLINETDTPTIARLMDEGINFTNFYTPGFGSVRTFNTELCINTGLYLPTNGRYAFDYCTNDFSEVCPADSAPRATAPSPSTTTTPCSTTGASWSRPWATRPTTAT